MGYNKAVIVMAAGAGTRFKSQKSKLLHSFAGKPIIKYLSSSLAKLDDTQIIFVVSYQKDEVIKTIGESKNFVFAEQTVLNGTAGAVKSALEYIDNSVKKVAVIPGDTPLIPADLVSQLLEDKNDVLVLGTKLKDPSGFGRIKTDTKGKVKEIIEETDLIGSDKKINMVNTSIYSFNRSFLDHGISEIKMNKNKKEFYLTDIVKLAVKSNKKVKCLEFRDYELVLGANDRAGMLESSRKIWMERAVAKLEEGVTIIDPSRTYLDDECKVGKDVEIYPNVFLTGDTYLEDGVIVLEGCRINNSRIGEKSVIGPYVFIDGADIGDQNKIGPFTYVRPGTKTSSKVKIGGFVETKKAVVGSGSKIPHLSYVGDAFIGENVNIGCGVITCNYDGVNKNITEIEDNAFVGSDCQLVAPVKIAKNAYVAAGTTLTKNVPQDALAISRTPQKNIEGYAKKIRDRKSKK